MVILSETIEKQLRVRKITQGTVIDHIPSGKALTVLKLLGISEDTGEPITIAMNVPSSKIGKKDVIKMENIFLTQEDVDKLALIGPKVTINKIEQTKIVQKSIVSIPDAFSGIIKCINPKCISNKPGELINSRFTVVNKKPLTIKCDYCQRIMEQAEIMSNFILR